ncbi:MAG: hypothetical protein A2166_04705 [Omnitrophica WOR_2 bacterium RBG_13_41_10]|nr:MAG: hypothetical protein A2166_04705 [Omnitrophica WOR_2 bacterium RBG_13_41_10]
MIFEAICVGPMQVNCYILAEEKKSPAIIIDPGEEEKKIRKILEKHKLEPAFIINTHGHIDHIGCDDKFNVGVYIHEDDLVLLKDPHLNLSAMFALPYRVSSQVNTLKDKENLNLGKIRLEVMHTPGHTPGGICLYMVSPEDKILFSGDTLFYHSIGRTDMQGADENALIDSINKKLLKLSDDTVIYPGHGPSSTIKEERLHNPYLN